MKILTLLLLLSACAAAPARHATSHDQPPPEARHEAEARVRPLQPLVTPDDSGPVRGGPGGVEIFRPGKGWTPVRGTAQ